MASEEGERFRMCTAHAPVGLLNGINSTAVVAWKYLVRSRYVNANAGAGGTFSFRDELWAKKGWRYEGPRIAYCRPA
jgi:hypothetical protein